MKKLLSLPPNLVSSFHELEEVSREEWFCTSDPIGARLGSGGGTVWLLESCRQAEKSTLALGDWIGREKRILLHAAGQSRRLPAYAPSGKVLTPVPVFRWARGQKLSQNLLSLQLPLYEQIMQKAPDSLHTLIASGDVYIRNEQPLAEIPEADVVCYGLWADPSQAVNHGVFLSRRDSPEVLDCMLQKPSLEELADWMSTHFFLMDIGVWLLSDKAVRLLLKKSAGEEGGILDYDLYGQFGLSLGVDPKIKDKDFEDLTVAILPLGGGEFYHFGTNRELISSTLAIQNRINDQRLIMHRKVKPHPAMFVQNAEVHYTLTADNSELWIENSYVGDRWKLHDKHLITGVPANDWKLTVPSGICIDVVPLGDAAWVARPYGYHDLFKGSLFDPTTLFLGQPVRAWAEVRGITLADCPDIQQAALFPVCDSIEELGEVMRWMISEPHRTEGKAIWERASKLSANALTDQANLVRLISQRKAFQRNGWPLLAKNHERSVFYQLDLADAASCFVKQEIPLPPPLAPDTPLIKQMSDAMFRARVLKLKGLDYRKEQSDAFRFLQEGMVEALKDKRQTPQLSVFPDQIVWGRSPVRIDLAGGWTDTPPFCLYAGGAVVNLAIELNGQPPLQVYVKPSPTPQIVLRSIDMGQMEIVSTWEELLDYSRIGSPFSIPKAALSLAGFAPAFSTEVFGSLEEQLRHLGCGIEITLLAAIPAGSGLGTSSILAATVLGALSDFCGLGWDRQEIGNRTLILEQLLTTGGGWQDPYGGLLHGLKLLQTGEGFQQTPLVRWLPDYLFTDTTYQPCHLLYYTGITRTAKDILAEIVQGMFLNSQEHLSLLNEMKNHAQEMYKTIQSGDFHQYGQLVGKTWAQNKQLDQGTNPPEVEQIIRRIHDYCLGYKLPGAGGGGYLYMVAKDPEAATHIRNILTREAPNANARFVEMNLSTRGLQVSRS
ncbi:bifunctional fucokinase/fucose-1-phosphate guanylyltransferase [Parabacteroides sp. PF5-6]|uniref:bifunctional fucokinase/fucose-1-phosphate guanylyltransferase n=1 Tax=Parabacteroides sp. PF5-6 TaxID=1742403 RepID=UPI002404E574|nr:bifunctional fucokinase/fucose-1-phosphate guanylyltransferase [Parabacteroides sp. PF5-6]MDF9831552.1 galactokinase/mevalonate kinase-like predicted kinase [Parabacteroides sp. PF5-6]